MRYYIIEDTTAFSSSWNSHILVKANNKKEAIEKTWIALGYNNQKNDIERGYQPHYKKEFVVKDIDNWFDEMKCSDSVAMIH